MPDPIPDIKRAFALEFRNIFGTQRLVVIASDIWVAMSAGDKHIQETFVTDHPFRLTASKEIDGTVLHATGADVLKAAE